VKNILPENKIYFNTYQEAIASGKRPCKQCKPSESDFMGMLDQVELENHARKLPFWYISGGRSCQKLQ